MPLAETQTWRAVGRQPSVSRRLCLCLLLRDKESQTRIADAMPLAEMQTWRAVGRQPSVSRRPCLCLLVHRQFSLDGPDALSIILNAISLVLPWELRLVWADQRAPCKARLGGARRLLCESPGRSRARLVLSTGLTIQESSFQPDMIC